MNIARSNSRGQITQETLGNGVVSNRIYDAVTGYLNSIQSGVGGGTGVQNESYLFDQVGNVTQRQNNTLGLTENFYYDNLYRLDYSKLNGVTNLDMTYDALGNITNRTDVASNAAWTYDATHKHQVKQAGDSSHTYTYDANGNAITRNGASIAWSKYNYPTVINGSGTVNVTLSYDANNQRWKQSYADSSGAIETTTYVGGLFEKVVSGTLTDWRFYVYANNEPVAVYSMKSNGVHALRYLVEDHQGSVDKITSSTGTVYASESFSAYGARRKATTWSGAPTVTDQNTMNGVTRQGYTWQTVMDNLSLVHMNGRVEDSVTGRFLSADPYITEPWNTQNYNRYSYVYNNPLSFIDPSGFNCDDQNSPNIGQCTDYSGGSSGAGWGGGGGDLAWANTYTTSDGVWHVDWHHYYFDAISAGFFASSSTGNGSTGNEGTSLAAPSPLPTATPQTQKPTNCRRVDWKKLGAGVVSSVLGTLQMTGGAATALAGAAAIPVPGVDAASAPMILGGLAMEGWGAVNVNDGVTMMHSAIDGIERRSTFGNVGYVFGGDRGAEVGERVSLAFGLLSLTNAGKALSALDAGSTAVGMSDSSNGNCP